MLKLNLVSFGILHLAIYDFEEIGDELPSHCHTEENVHIGIVTNGSVEINGDGWSKIAKAGNIIDFRPMQHHGFKALEKDTRVINIIKGTGKGGGIPSNLEEKIDGPDEQTRI